MDCLVKIAFCRQSIFLREYGMKIKLLHKIFILFLSSTLFFSCTTLRDYSTVYNELGSKNYDLAYQQLEAEKESIYTDKDELLYSLDSGLLAHYNRNYEESNSKLSNAERLIESYYSKSISQGINSFFTNDNAQDYSGEEYEDIYSNLFMALNYIHLGQIEDAFVEIRRFDNKQKSLSVKYSEELAYAKENAEGNLDASVQFNNSALARYLSMILYRSRNQMDSAEVDRKKITEAFKTQAALYPFEIPLAVNEEFSIPKDMARLNIMSFAGFAPLKFEESMGDIYQNGFTFKISIPEMQKRGTQVNSISVLVFGKNGESYVEKMEKIESIENIAYDTFNQKRALIYAKAFIRSMSKTAVSTTFDVLSATSDDNETAFALLALASKVWTVASEAADLRTSQFFPAEAYVGGITLPEGEYVVEVRYLDKHNRLLSSEVFENVIVSKNKLNLVETLCVK